MVQPCRSYRKPVITVLMGSLAALLLLLPSCRHEHLVVPDTPTAPTNPVDTTPIAVCDTDTVYFLQQVLPLVGSYCGSTGCHNSTSHAANVRLDDYGHIMSFVSPGYPTASDLVLYAQGPYMPPANWPQLSAAQLALIIKWIAQGAHNNSCNNGCDTTTVTYNAIVKPIFQNACYGCHSASNISGNFNISTWAACNAAATNGTLGGDVQGLPGHYRMPPLPSVLSSCSRNRIMRWIHQGALNN